MVASVALTGDTTLVVADGVAILRANADFQLSLGQRRLPCGRYTLSLLDAFSRPTSMKQALEHLKDQVKGTSAWIELVAHLKGLHEVGVLVEPGATTASRRAHGKRFDSAPVHIRMLNDVVRTSSFQEAIRMAVTPADIVLDIGTGTGLLAVTAALAGARHVYAIEDTAISEVARRLVEANGVGDRVTIIDGHSFDVDLPERATVLVSEIIGDDPLGESILATFTDARERLLVDGARVIPSRLQVCVLPLEVPVDRMEAMRFTSRRTAVWSDLYDVDLGGLVAAAEERPHRVHVNSYDTRAWKRLADPVVVADLDLFHRGAQPIDTDVPLPVIADGSVSALLVYFEAALGGGARISLHPDAASPSNSWGNLLYVLATPLDVAAGQNLNLAYRYDGRGSELKLDGARA